VERWRVDLCEGLPPVTIIITKTCNNCNRPMAFTPAKTVVCGCCGAVYTKAS